jgi:hypothetical protein
MGAGKQTVFLLPETSIDLVKRANLECTHLMHSKLALFTGARASGDLAAMVQEAPYRKWLVSSKSKSGFWCPMELLDIGGSMGTVPRQESVSNSSMGHRELLKWHCSLPKSAGRARRIPDFQIFSSGEISKSIFGAARHVRTCASR